MIFRNVSKTRFSPLPILRRVHKGETMYAFSIVEILSGDSDIRLITLNERLDASIDGSSVFFSLTVSHKYRR